MHLTYAACNQVGEIAIASSKVPTTIRYILFMTFLRISVKVNIYFNAINL